MSNELWNTFCNQRWTLGAYCNLIEAQSSVECFPFNGKTKVGWRLMLREHLWYYHRKDAKKIGPMVSTDRGYLRDLGFLFGFSDIRSNFHFLEVSISEILQSRLWWKCFGWSWRCQLWHPRTGAPVGDGGRVPSFCIIRSGYGAPGCLEWYCLCSENFTDEVPHSRGSLYHHHFLDSWDFEDFSLASPSSRHCLPFTGLLRLYN